MRSLQTRAQATAVAGSSTWWPMADARGEKIVRSWPRSRATRSWLPSIVARISSSLIRGSAGTGSAGSFEPGELGVAELLQRGRRRRVVTVTVDDHLRVSSPGRGGPELPGLP